jgi:lipopolysaccharide transport system ATP-binding protein
VPVATAFGRDLDIEVEIHSPDGRSPQLAIGVIRADGTAVYGTTSEIAGVSATPLTSERYRFRLRLENLALLPGHYTLKLHALDPEGLRLFDTDSREILVRGDTRELGLVRLSHRWL